MMKLFKHNYFRYLLLVILSLKLSFFVVESLNYGSETEICCEIDFEDTENDEKSELDEEPMYINQGYIFRSIFIALTNTTHYFITSNLYRIQHIEFNTPPPKVV